MSDATGSEPRHASIIDLVGRQGFLTLDSLARHFGVTVQTIRRDVNQLAAEGRLSRYRGGAGLASSIENMEYERRQVVNLEAKQRIAARLAADVPHHAALFINIGTTTEQAARALLAHRGLQVVTNNINVAKILSENPNIAITIAGGRVRHRDGAITGQTTLAMLEQYRVDIGIIGISAIDADGGLYDYDLDEVLCAQAIIRNSRRVFLLADHSKFSRHALVKVGDIWTMSAVYTDAPLAPDMRTLLEAAGVIVHIAGGNEAPAPIEGAA
jgi:DeoR family glycerol-3-phosphate regulon repressor